MAQFNDVYQRARYYDIAFRRDVRHEVDFIMTVFQQYSESSPASLLDLACGPGYHARDFASRGLRAVGLDLRPEMIDFACEEAAQEGVQVEWLAADMRNFHLAQPVDVAINVFDGIDCLLTNAALIEHLRAVADNLTPHGLYFIDVTHPRDASLAHYHRFSYSGERDGIHVRVNWGINEAMPDLVTGVAHTQIELYINDHGQESCIIDTADERFLTAQEITLLADLSGVFTPVAWFGAYNVAQPLDYTPTATRMIAVLRKILPTQSA